ncbi:MAG: hypothetical protein PHQ91_05325 [Thermoanaerobaculaceae bacterium]|nr:hypothetical protein [Thermoanaerobaculaceae bacterium]
MLPTPDTDATTPPPPGGARAAWLFAAGLIVAFLSWRISPGPMFLATTVATLVVLRRVFAFPVAAPYLTALAVAGAYLHFWGETYNYAHPSLHFGKVPLFPLLAWPYGLTLLLFWSGRLARWLGVTSTAGRIAVGYAVFAPSLVAVEWVGYQFCDIRLSSHHAGFLGLDCIHIPPAMTAVYFANGLVFLVVMIGVVEPLRVRLRWPGRRLTAEPVREEIEP